MEVVFLTFGGQKIGTGHLFRCLAFAEWLDKLYDQVHISFCLYNCSNEDIEVSSKIIEDRSDYKIFIYDHERLSEIKYKIVIVDLLDISLSFMQKLKEISRFIISVDNTSNSRQLAGININPLYYSIEETKEEVVLNDYIGPQYQIISPRFYRKRSKWNEEVKNILIIQGGADPFKVTDKILNDIKGILEVKQEIKLHLVSGPASKLNDRLVNKHNARVVFHSNIIDIPELLSNIDLAISSVGITAFELMSMAIPTIYVTAIEKELETGEALEKLGVGKFLGKYEELQYGHLYNNVLNIVKSNEMRVHMRENCLKKFSKNGAENFIKSIFNKDLLIKLEVGYEEV